MSSTCDYTKYEEFEKESKFGKIKRLRNVHAELDINCDLNGQNYKIGNFSILRCPTCGRALFENYGQCMKK